MTPERCVVDTNVAVTADGRNDTATAACMAASARVLNEVMTKGHLFIDADREIIDEYQRNLAVGGEPKAGATFLKWLLTNEWDVDRVTRVRITKDGSETGYAELPAADDGTRYDRSDCKFLAVAAAHPDHPPVLQALDTKWWGWRAPLAKCDVTLHFVCEDEIAVKHREKRER